jgi:aryl-alcohol dehydrogenase-like predicted oxidoreductase
VQYVGLPPCPFDVSRIWLGGWQIGGRSFGFISDDVVEEVFTVSRDVGITCIDVAPSYGRGRAEELAGRFAGPDQHIVTKVGLRWGPDEETYNDLSPASVRYELDASLRRLNRDHVDLYLVHWPDPATPLEDTFEVLDALRVAGKIRAIGICNYALPDVVRIASMVDLACVQSRLNLLEQENASLAEACRQIGVGFVSHSTLAIGLLSGKYGPGASFDDARTRYPMYTPAGLEDASRRIDKLRADSERLGKSLLGFSISAVLGMPGVSAAVIGTRSGQQLQEAVTSVYG